MFRMRSSDDSGGEWLEVGSSEELSAVEAFWRRGTARVDNPFATYDWNRACLRHLGGADAAPAVLAWGRGGSLRCLFPFVRRRDRLDFLGAEICDFQDLVACSMAEAREGVEALLPRLAESGERLALSKVADRSRLHALLPEIERDPAFVLERCLVGPCPWLPIPGGDLEQVTAAFGKATRKGARRRLRALDAAIRPRLEVVEGYDAGFLEVASGLHLARWGDGKGESLFRRGGFDGFLREVGSSPEVGLLGFGLRAPDGRLVGFELGFERLGRYHSWMGAYDAAFAEFSPGICLQLLAMAELGRRGIGAYDFLCGGELYKFRFASEEYAVHSVALAPRSLATLAGAGMRRLERRLRPGVKRCLHSVGFYRTGYRIDDLV
jgi:CelD/BcsL family acetyltransferase involved in cellulose biosynthesis